MGLFSKKSVKATNEPFNPFIGNNASGPIDVTPVSSTDETVKPVEEVEPTVDTETTATDTMVEEPVSTEIPVTDNEDVVDTEEAATSTSMAEPVIDDVSDQVVATKVEPDVIDTPTEEESIIDSIQADEPAITEENLAAAAEESAEVADEPEPVDETPVDMPIETPAEAPEVEESPIPAASVVEDVPSLEDAAVDDGTPIFDTSPKKSGVSAVLLIIAALVCVGLAVASALLYLKWQDQQNLTLEKDETINRLTRQINDSDLVNSDIDQLKDEITSLKEENKSLSEDKLKLEENNKTLTEENNRLKTQNENLQANTSDPNQ